MMIVSIRGHIFIIKVIIILTGGIVSLSQSQYSVAEGNTSLTVTLTMSSRTSKDIIVEVTISNGSANGIVE